MTDDRTVRRILDVLAVLGPKIAETKSSDDALRVITAQCLDVVEGAQDAGVTRARDVGFETVAETGDVPLAVDALQYELGSGPCVDAAIERTVYRTGDLHADARWPDFGHRAADEVGVQSMLSFRLFFEDDDYIAALNMYSKELHAFSDDALMAGLAVSMFGALSVTNSRHQARIVNLERALESNRDIGVAIGVLMALHKVTRQQAFDLLRVASQRLHRKLAHIAHEVAETGLLPFS
jgi:hypothetical protein